MPYSAYAIRYAIPTMLEEAEALIMSSAAAGIPDEQLAPLRSLITEGYELATDAGVSPMHWLTYSSRLSGALIAFEYEVVLPLSEVADVAAIA